LKEVLVNYPDSLVRKAKKIKAVISDVDGVLTDGGIIYDNQGNEFKKFNVKDGLIIKYLRETGILVGFISGRSSAMVERRLNELKVDFYFQGVANKDSEYEKVKAQWKLKDEMVAYIGDDINDLSLIVKSGLGVTPQDAPEYVRKQADMIASVAGGQGVFREVAELILAAQDKLKPIIDKQKIS